MRALLALLAGAAALLYVSRSAGAISGASSADVGAAPLDLVGELGALSAGAQSLIDGVGATMQKLFTLPAAAAPYLDAINAASAQYGLPDGLLGSLLYEESRYRPDIISGQITSGAGAVGIAQFMPATAADLGIDPTDPYQSIDAAAKYLRRLFDHFGTWADTLAAYNWGSGNVARRGTAAAPAETQNYVTSILGRVPELS